MFISRTRNRGLLRGVFPYAQLYRAVKLGYSSLPSLVYFGNMFWCVYFGILFAIFFLLGQEPLAGFRRTYPENYLVFQFLKAALLLGHFLLCLLLAVCDFGQGRLFFCRVASCSAHSSTCIKGLHYHCSSQSRRVIEARAETPILNQR